MAFTLLVLVVGIASCVATIPTPREKAEEVIGAFKEVGLLDDVRPCFHYIEATFGDHNEWYKQFEIEQNDDGPQLTAVPQAFACMQQCVDFALRLTDEKNITTKTKFVDFVDLYGPKVPVGVRFRAESKEHFDQCSQPEEDPVSIINSDVVELDSALEESCKLDFDIVYCLNKQTFFHKWDQEHWVAYWNELFNIINEEDAEEAEANLGYPEVPEGDSAVPEVPEGDSAVPEVPEEESEVPTGGPHGDHHHTEEEEEEEEMDHMAQEAVPPVPEP